MAARLHRRHRWSRSDSDATVTDGCPIQVIDLQEANTALQEHITLGNPLRPHLSEAQWAFRMPATRSRSKLCALPNISRDSVGAKKRAHKEQLARLQRKILPRSTVSLARGELAHHAQAALRLHPPYPSHLGAVVAWLLLTSNPQATLPEGDAAVLANLVRPFVTAKVFREGNSLHDLRGAVIAGCPRYTSPKLFCEDIDSDENIKRPFHRSKGLDERARVERAGLKVLQSNIVAGIETLLSGPLVSIEGLMCDMESPSRIELANLIACMGLGVEPNRRPLSVSLSGEKLQFVVRALRMHDLEASVAEARVRVPVSGVAELVAIRASDGSNWNVGTPMSLAAASSSLDRLLEAIQEEQRQGAAAVSDRLFLRLVDTLKGHPNFLDIRGCGIASIEACRVGVVLVKRVCCSTKEVKLVECFETVNGSCIQRQPVDITVSANPFPFREGISPQHVTQESVAQTLEWHSERVPQDHAMKPVNAPRDMAALVHVIRCSSQYYESVRGCGMHSLSVTRESAHEGMLVVHRSCGSTVSVSVDSCYSDGSLRHPLVATAARRRPRNE